MIAVMKMEIDYMKKIKELRIQNKLTQTELSTMLGLSPSAYGLYETYQRRLDIDTLVKICRLFHVSADSLLGLNQEQR